MPQPARGSPAGRQAMGMVLQVKDSGRSMDGFLLLFELGLRL